MHSEAPRRKSGRMIMLGVYNAAGYALRVTNKHGWALGNDQRWGYEYSGDAWELTHASNCDFTSAIMNISKVYTQQLWGVCVFITVWGFDVCQLTSEMAWKRYGFHSSFFNVRLKSPANRPHVQQFIHANNNENIETPHHLFNVREYTDGRWIPFTMGQKCHDIIVCIHIQNIDKFEQSLCCYSQMLLKENRAFRTACQPGISNQINESRIIFRCFHLQHGPGQIPLVPGS